MNTPAKPCVLIGGLTKIDPQYDDKVSSDAAPRTDFIELARKLDAEMPLHPLAESRIFPPIRRVEQKGSLDLSMAAWIARNSRKYNAIISLAETVGIPLAGALKLLRRKVPHVLVGHKLSWRIQRYTWRFTKLQNAFDAVACVSKAQAEYAASETGMNIDKGVFIYDKVDEKFFSPRKVDDEGYVLSVGQEQRDYHTLVKALEGTGKKVVIVASSPWATKSLNLPPHQDDVIVKSRIPFTELRDLYARAKVVAVSVHNVDFAAGVNVLLEGMSMAKPVVCCDTPGLSGYVENDVTAKLVPPENSGALRDIVLSLWDNPKERGRLGEAGRSAIEAAMTLDHYVDRLAQLVNDAI